MSGLWDQLVDRDFTISPAAANALLKGVGVEHHDLIVERREREAAALRALANAQYERSRAQDASARVVDFCAAANLDRFPDLNGERLIIKLRAVIQGDPAVQAARAAFEAADRAVVDAEVELAIALIL